jgi:hypothetical protein
VLVHVLQIGQAVGRHRVGGIEFRIGIAGEAVAEFLVLQLLEEIERTAPGNPRLGEILRPGRVGLGFLRATEREVAAQRRLLPGHEHAKAGVGRSGGSGQPAQQQRKQGDAGGRLRSRRADHVAAGDVAQLVGEHALHFVDVVGRADEAGMDIDCLPTGHESVDRAIVEQDDIDIARIEPRRLDDRRRHVAKQRFGFRIAQHVLRQHRLRGERQGRHGGTDSRQGAAQAGEEQAGLGRGAHHDAGYCGAE